MKLFLTAHLATTLFFATSPDRSVHSYNSRARDLWFGSGDFITSGLEKSATERTEREVLELLQDICSGYRFSVLAF
jgi:hypothetical protein